MDPAEMLRRGFTRETAIRRDAKGRWWNGDELVEHVGVTRSFDGWIDRAPDGRFCLANDINWAFVAIEGPPYFVRSVELPSGPSDDTIVLCLSGGLREPLDPSTLRLGPDDGLYCDVRGGRVPARFDDHATHQLASRLDADALGPYFRVAGALVRPSVVADPLGGWDPSKGDVESAKR
jgi:hypothetical protein